MKKPVMRGLAATLIYGLGQVFAAEYYVSPDGVDTNDGSQQHPFGTIQHAFNNVAAGDTIFLRAGHYHEEVDLSNIHGAAGQVITLKPYADELAVLDGRVTIPNSNWQLHSGNIYKTQVTEDIWQLWVDEAPSTLARWPDAKVWSDDFWKQSVSWALTDVDGSNHNGWVEDAALSEITVPLTGCVMVMNSFNWKSRVSTVSAHTPGEGSFEYSPQLTDYSSKTNKFYFLTGLALLDSPGEWFYDASQQTLYLWCEDGTNPSSKVVTAKNQSYFFHGGGGKASHLRFEGLRFMGTTMQMSGCGNITLEDCDFLYPVCSKRTLGMTGDAATGNFAGAHGLQVLNCTFMYSDGRPLLVANSNDLVIDNNLFYQTDYACLASNSNSYTVQMDGGRRPVYRRNEIHIAGASESCRISCPAYPDSALVELNYHTQTGLMQTDGASVQYPPGGCADSINRYNWFMNQDATGFRFDGNPAGDWGNVYRNVAALGGTRGFRLKGDWHEIYNNVGMDSIKDDINIAKDKGPAEYNGQSNHNSITRNNAADNVNLGNNYADSSHYWDGVNHSPSKLRDQLRDPDNLDFRPRAGSALIDAGEVVDSLRLKSGGQLAMDVSATYVGAAPDIGAYEFGDSDYFIPGRILPEASKPVPPVATTSAKVDCDLMWLGGEDAIGHRVYFGTQSGNLNALGEQTNNICTPPGVQAGVTYYWRVDTVTADGVVVGEEWHFTTEQVDVLANRSPYFHRQDVLDLPIAQVAEAYSHSMDIYLSDPDGDVLSYRLLSAPSWLEVSASGELTGTASSEDAGVHHLELEVDDGRGGVASASFSLFVNHPPQFVSQVMQWPDATDGVYYLNNLHDWVVDPDGDALSFTILDYGILSGGEVWSIDELGRFRGLPTYVEIGDRVLTLEVSDGSASSVAEVHLSVRAGDYGVWQPLLSDSFEDGIASSSVPATAGMHFKETSTNADPNFVKAASGDVDFVGQYAQIARSSSKSLIQSIDYIDLKDTQIQALRVSYALKGANLSGTDRLVFKTRSVNDDGWIPRESYTHGVNIETGVRYHDQIVLDRSVHGNEMKLQFATGTGSSSRVFRVDDVVVEQFIATVSAPDYAAIEVASEEALAGGDVTELWLMEHQLPLADQVNWNSDADGDGMHLLMEYAMGTDPRVDDSQAGTEELLALEPQENAIQLRFKRRVDAAERGLLYTIENSGDMNVATWQAVDASPEVQPIDSEFESIQMSVPPTEQRMFYRLKVARP